MTRTGQLLARSFYDRPSSEVAVDLLGCWLVRRSARGLVRAQIVETEAYLGEEDPASHAHRGPTPRNLPMYGPPGFAYVYFIYGMHHCLNVVTGPEGVPAAVLIRGAVGAAAARMDGPGRLCRALDVDLSLNRLDLCSGDRLWLERGNAQDLAGIQVGPRVGVRDPAELRFRISPGMGVGSVGS